MGASVCTSVSTGAPWTCCHVEVFYVRFYYWVFPVKISLDLVKDKAWRMSVYHVLLRIISNGPARTKADIELEKQ